MLPAQITPPNDCLALMSNATVASGLDKKSLTKRLELALSAKHQSVSIMKTLRIGFILVVSVRVGGTGFQLAVKIFPKSKTLTFSFHDVVVGGWVT